MDINKNNVNKPTRVFDKFISKTNTYIPAMHKNTVDTFEKTTKSVSFKGNTVTKEDVLSKLNNVDIPETVKKKIEEKLEKQNQIALANKLLSDERIYGNEYIQESLDSFLSSYMQEEAVEGKSSVIDKYLSDPTLIESPDAQKVLRTALSFVTNANDAKMANKLLSDSRLYSNPSIKDKCASILNWSRTQELIDVKFSIIDKYLETPELNENENIQRIIGGLIQRANSIHSGELAIKFLSEPNLYQNEGLQKNIHDIIASGHTDGKYEVVNGFLSNPALYENTSLQSSIHSILLQVMNPQDLVYSSKLFEFVKNGEIDTQLAINLVKSSDKLRYKQVRKLRETIPQELFNKIAQSQHDLVIASSLLPLYGKNNLNEVPLVEKRNVLRGLLKSNADLFWAGKELQAAFPLIPKNREEYCSLLPSLVKSLGIETRPLTETQISEFENDILSLSSSVAKLSETEFDNLDVSLSYGKNEFIEDVLECVKDISQEERQKVFDYFGFEIKQNEKSPIGHSLIGYPVNIQNGEKLSQITETKTKEVIEALRPKVIEFSENNIVQSNDENIGTLLNKILDVLPELNTTINRPQHGAHQYDVFKHSLKVMQKIVQNPKFESLNDSDKKIILLASLLHDITKAEGRPDPNHETECSFDAFYIAKKFNLPQEEHKKLYKLIETHEWLKYVNNNEISQDDQIKRMQSVAFDLQNDNIFELSKIFTEADIKAIKKNDGLYSAFGPALEKFSKPIDEYINELRKTKPILPTTKLPKATELADKITTVNSDSSTNIKGVYKQDGLIVIKYNEVENWEDLGFAKADISRGIQTTNPIDGTLIDTGTIKFIAHGLEEANQLINFNAFNLPNSDALLSVSYMERPESKYRLYKTQGVLLQVSPNNIYGGGKSDSGSGNKKTISDFKLKYIFGGKRESDRNYISNLIKENLGLNDEEYIKFVQENANKSMNEIEPIETRNALIKSFALINSDVRIGDRAYNEMYVSNPIIQAVYAYSPEDSVGDVSEFIENQPQYLKDYAKQNDLLFFVFGD